MKVIDPIDTLMDIEAGRIKPEMFETPETVKEFIQWVYDKVESERCDQIRREEAALKTR
jgi:hypothetical protein